MESEISICMDSVFRIIETPWGRVGVTVGNAGLQRVVFNAPPAPALTGVWADTLAAYLAGQPIPPHLPVDLSGMPPFTRRVLEACRAIPFGATASYAELAARLGCPRAARAVGQALARNPVPIVIPCHRVIGASGKLTGFLGGLTWKRQLLAHEGAVPGSI
jgi:methylated-DNA-[protein]-cysteine S-methyltransferase